MLHLSIILVIFAFIAIVLLLRSFIAALFPGKPVKGSDKAVLMDDIDNAELYNYFK